MNLHTYFKQIVALLSIVLLISCDKDFNEINNYQNTFRFSAHYTVGGISKTKVVAITFNKGDNKTETLTLN